MKQKKGKNILGILVFTLLIVSIANLVSAAQSTVGTEFDVLFDYKTCVLADEQDEIVFPEVDAGLSYWIDPLTSAPHLSLERCYNPNSPLPIPGIRLNEEGQEMLADEGCCPAQYYCDADSDSPTYNTCVYDGVYYCGQHPDETACNEENGHPAEAQQQLNPTLEAGKKCFDYFDISSNENCADYIDCRCYWDVADEECYADYDIRTEDLEDTTIPIRTWSYPLDTTGQTYCSISSVEDNTGTCQLPMTITGSCEDGDTFIRRSWGFVWSGDPSLKPLSCVAGSDTISCENVVRLGFFNYINIILIVLILIAIYFAIIKKQKKSSKKKKK
ncbi:MAG: hypothetical protein ABIH37_01765 [archaeon]